MVSYILLIISTLTYITQSALFTSGQIDIVNPNKTNPLHTETHNASITININTDSNIVELIMTRYIPPDEPLAWTGFGFEYLPYDSTNFHNGTYAIILEYNETYEPIVSEYTLGFLSAGIKYTNPEITVMSDITTNGIWRETIVHRPIYGTFNFPNARFLPREPLTIMGAIHARTPLYSHSLRHQGNIDDRNMTTAIFEFVDRPCYILQGFVQTQDLDLKLTINCPANRIEIDIKYLDYRNNWFGIVFNNEMLGDALVYTEGKSTDNIYPRAVSLYSYKINGKQLENIEYESLNIWTQKMIDIQNGIHIIFTQTLSETQIWDGTTTEIPFRYAIGETLELSQHTFKSETTSKFNLQTQFPTSSPTNDIYCPNGDVLEGSQKTDDLILDMVLNCTSQKIRLYIYYEEWNGDEWFGIVFNNQMFGDSVVYTIGKNSDKFVGLYFYELHGQIAGNVIYDGDRNWNKLLIDDGVERPGITLVYEQYLSKTQWNSNTTNIIFRYAIGYNAQLTKHRYFSTQIFNMELTVGGVTPAPTPAPVIDVCPYGDLEGSIMISDLRLRMEILCETEQTVTLSILYPDFNYNWFGLVFNNEMFGYSLVYTKGKQNNRDLLLYTYNITGKTIDNVIYAPENDWFEIRSNDSINGWYIEYNNALDNTPFNGTMKTLIFRYAIGNELMLAQHRAVSQIYTIHFESKGIVFGPTCGGLMSEPCKPDYNCVNDPTIPCTYGKDADCPGVCLWIKATCNDITCKGNDKCFQFNNGPICCDPEICVSDQKCGGIMDTSCEDFGLFGYECVDNLCDRNKDIDCAGICVNPNATPEPETTTEPVNSICPLGRPEPGDKCDFEGVCFYGKEYCCGQTFDSFGCKCDINGQTACFYTDECLGAPGKCDIDVKGPVCGQDVKQCYDGTYVNRDPNNKCQFPKCEPKPVCGGFKNCQAYNDGCNYCMCGENGNDICQSRYCPPELQNEKAKCTGCKYGYELNDYTGKCEKTPQMPEIPQFIPEIPPQIPEIPPQMPKIPTLIPVVKPCCNRMDRPIGCMEGSACCPDGTWTCGIGNGGFSCGGYTLFPNQDNFGKICSTANTLPPGCAALTCAIDSYCCDDGFGVKCCSKDIPNYGKVSCDEYSDCDRDNGYKCHPDPLCKGNGGSCSEQKVCLSSGGTCDSDLDCEFEMDYKCISVTKTVGFCIKYQ